MRWITVCSWLTLCSLSHASGVLDQLPVRNNEANALFQAQKYEDALKMYLDLYGQDQQGEQKGALAYNIANTFAQLGQMEKAEEFYQKAASSPHPEAQNRARFNLGNLQMGNQKLKEAVQNYVDDLRRNPDDPDAKRNLEIALRQMEQQQQQQQQDQENQEQNEDQEQEQQQQQGQNQDGESDEEQKEQQQPQEGENQEDQQQQQQDPQSADQEQNPDEQQQAQQQDQQPEDEKERQEQQAKENQEGEEPLNESMKQQILQALEEQEKQQQKEYQKRKIGPVRRRAKDW